MRTKMLPFLLLLAATSVTAAEPVLTVKVSPFGAPWRAAVGVDGATRTLRIVSSHKISLKVELASPFLGVVSGEEVTVAPETTTVELEPNGPKLIRLTFSKFPRAEVYEGAIAVRTNTTPVRDLGIAALHLDAGVKPVLTVPTMRSFSRVNTGADWLASLLLGKEQTEGEALVRVQSNTPRRLSTLRADAVLVGQKTEREIGSALLRSKSVGSSDLGIARVPLTIDRATLPPDRYTGSVLLASSEIGDAAVAIPSRSRSVPLHCFPSS